MTSHDAARPVKPSESATGQPATPLSRRNALKGAAVATGMVWVSPAMQFISMESAAAASAPPPRVETGPPPQPGPDPDPSDVGGTSGTGPDFDPGTPPRDDPPAESLEVSSAGQAAGSGQGPAPAAAARSASALPQTGADEQTAAMAATGLGAVLLGGAAIAAARRLMDEPADDPSSDGTSGSS